MRKPPVIEKTEIKCGRVTCNETIEVFATKDEPMKRMAYKYKFCKKCRGIKSIFKNANFNARFKYNNQK